MAWQWYAGQAKVWILEAWVADAPATVTCTALQDGFCQWDTHLALNTTTTVPPVNQIRVTHLQIKLFVVGWLIQFYFILWLVYAEVFWKGCLPGGQGNLCKVCMGGTEEAATRRCTDNHNERYYGNMGALRWGSAIHFTIQIRNDAENVLQTCYLLL